MFSVQIKFHFFIIACLILLLSGCSMAGHHKVEDLHQVAMGSSPARTYQVSAEEVKQAALYSMKQTGLENITEHQMGYATWTITGEIGYSWRSNGQFIRISALVDNDTKPQLTKIFYNSLKRFDINVTEDLTVIREKLLNIMDSFIESQ